MAVEILFEYEGLDEWLGTLERLAGSLEPSKVEPLFKRGAAIAAKEMRAKVPRGPTLNLHKAIKIKKLNRLSGEAAPYIAAIDRKIAPHAWLVIHGTSGVRPVNPPRVVKIGGETVRISNTGRMPPNSFFRDAINNTQKEILFKLEIGIDKLIEEAISR